MLFVADDGAPLSGEHLSRKIGDHCELRFGRRSTAHPFRNAAVSYVVGEAPEEADLAPLVINHKRAETTNRGTGARRKEATRLRRRCRCRHRCRLGRASGFFQPAARALAARGTRRARSPAPVGQKGYD
jgi:hypothetical protein